ncbi:hypothetical protein [Lederbergia galactosidilytica]|uniref:Uncharacterized protein n=1 Tax=Lederbergia galactosidilytica TaxID=217031 RepID=A0A177ZGV7_9BACI|nr:hypothetical protein [Lederbergia galactosidilytica]OAK67166.1 hypothetical protein ABB05_21685 [Lederbergia galactosidilytica]
MNSKNNAGKSEHILEDEELMAALEEQIATLQWIQAAAVLTEAVLLSKLYSLKENVEEGEDKILTGIWVQTLGQLTEALGVTQQINTTDKSSIFKAEKTAVTGDLIQSIGAGLQAWGGEELLKAAAEELIP